MGKWLIYLTNGLKEVENDLEICEMAKIFGKWLRCMVHGLSFSGTSLLCWKWLKNLTKGLNMRELTYVCGKWFKYLRSG